MTAAQIKASFDFTGHERIMHQRHLIAETTELTERTSLDSPTDVRKCGSHTYAIPYAEPPYFLRVSVRRQVAKTGRPNFIFSPSAIYFEL